MISFDLRVYRPAESLYLWWLANPAVPHLVGELRETRSTNRVSLVYAASWLEEGFPLCEDLPLMDTEFFPNEAPAAAGAVDDARPGRWGERVIRFLDKPPRLSVLEPTLRWWSTRP